MTIYNNLTDMEALKIGTHHNLVAERSKEMSFVDKVGIVKKVVDTDPPNLYKTLEGIFGAKVKATFFKTKYNALPVHILMYGSGTEQISGISRYKPSNNCCSTNCLV